MEINDRFKAARVYLGKNQSEIASEVNVKRFKRSAVSQLERFISESPNPHYIKYLEKNGINSDWLLYGEGEMLEEKVSRKEYQEIKKENSYLKEKLKKLEEKMELQAASFKVTMESFFAQNLGKNKEHKKAAQPEEKKTYNNTSSVSVLELMFLATK